MPGTFKDIFTYAGPAGEDGFYTFLGDSQNSMDCHETMLELFLNVLKLSSIQYRTGAFPAPSPVAAIPDAATLDNLLNIVPEDLQDPLTQVMYEQFAIVTDPVTIGTNAWYIKTSTDAASTAELQSAVDDVRAFNYANEYNSLRTIYASEPWAVGIPAAIALTNMQSPPAKAAVITAINNLGTWIVAHDPQLVALTTLGAKTAAADILTDVFGDNPVENVQPELFATALVKKIKMKGYLEVTNPIPASKTAKRVFFEDVQTNLKMAGTIWQTTPDLKVLADQINAIAPSDILKNPTKVTSTFDKICEVFNQALVNPATVASARQQILAILTAFNSNTTSVADFLLTRLQEACAGLATTLNPDPQMLNGWVDEINMAVPTTIHYSEIDGLMELVVDQLSQLQLTYQSINVTLFAFTNYDDIEAKLPTAPFSPGGSASDSDLVLVAADASEDGNVYSRPIFGVFTTYNAGTHETFLKFFNISNISAGTFYFSDPNDPAGVKQDFFPDPVSESTVTFNFAEATIENSKVVPAGGLAGYPEGIPYRMMNGPGTSNTVFYNVIRNISKWKALDGRLSYDAIYQTVFTAPDTVGILTHLIWYLSTGDLDRTDKIDDELCLWQWMAPEEYKAMFSRLPDLLQLPAERNIDNFDGAIELIDRQTANGFNSVLQFAIATDSGSAGTYVLTNTPSNFMPEIINDLLERESGTVTASAPLADHARELLSVFNFHYYRKIDPDIETVIKCLPAAHRPASLADGIDVTDWYPDRPTECQNIIAMNNPLSFRLPHNIAFFKLYTAANAPAGIKLKNKGANLYRAGGKRLAAGSVMAALRNDMNTPPAVPGTNSSLPATAMSSWELDNSADARAAWQNLIYSARNDLPVDQEWCHLLGHGDGGDERLGNFASGSFHCNTEQLAMESKNRRAITRSAAKGTYTLRSTAYLFSDGKVLLKNNYLSSDKTYARMTSLYSALRKPDPAPPPINKPGTVLPFAALFRYKMYADVAGAAPGGAVTRAQFNKLFDHLFEGQSEFMDQYQFNILKYPAWFCLVGMDAFQLWYAEQTDADMQVEASA